MRSCKNPEFLQIIFPRLLFILLFYFFHAQASDLNQRIHMNKEREKEKE